MSLPRPNFRIRVDITNPAQFFACCGLLEVANRLAADNSSGPTGHFQLDDGRFIVTGSVCSAIELIKWVTECEPSKADMAGDGLAPLALPRLRLQLDWWRERSNAKAEFRKTPFKLWAGQQSPSGIYAALRDAVRALIKSDAIEREMPLHSQAFLTGRFGFDPGAAWNALDAGFSPNEQGFSVTSLPVAELLAAIGLQRFRPVKAEERNAYEYVAWAASVPTFIAAAAATGAIPDAAARRFQFRIVSRGSYRCFSVANEIRRAL